MKVFIILLSVVVLLLLIYLFVLLFPGLKGKRKIDKALLTDYAHRGLHNGTIPENSLAAFRRAVENGYGIELDVQLSKDGKVMVFHDYTLVRMTGDDRKLKELTGEELKSLRLKNTEESIPYLTEVLELVDGKVPLLVELKGEDLNTALCPKVDEIMSQYKGPYCIESFNPMLLAWYKKHHSDVIRGILTTKVCKDRGFSVLNYLLDTMMLNFLSRPDFIAYDISYEKLSVKLCTKLFGAPAFVWTVRKIEDYEKLPDDACVIFEGFIPKTK